MQFGEPLIVVIDDDEGICRSLARMLEAASYRTRTYFRAGEYLAESDSLDAACVLVDIRMPDLDGISLVRALREAGADTPVVFMTATGNVPTVVEAMKQGAVDLLAKPFTAEALLAAVQSAVFAGHQTQDEHRALASLWQIAARLTPREAEVCGLVACGLPNKIVAAHIGTVDKTVKVHRSRVMRKLGVPSLAALVRTVDRLLAEPRAQVLHLDGVDVPSPPAVETLVKTVTRVRANVTPPSPQGDIRFLA
jgi:FixJ family two-component response regulator